MSQSLRDSASQPAPNARSAVLDVVTVIFVILTVAVLAWIVLIINDPSIALNPLPPPTVAPVVQPPTLTPSPTVTDTPTVTPTFTPSHTPTATPTPTATATPTDTATPTATLTQVFSGVPTATLTPDQPTAAPALDDGSGGTVPGSGATDDGSAMRETPGSGGSTPLPRATATRAPFPFTAAPVRYEANTGDQGCQWLSIAGTVTDLNGRALPDVAIEINGDNFHSVQFSGSAARWGTAGYEFNLGAAPRAAAYTLRVLGPTGGPISAVIDVETGNTCQRNIAIVDFIQNHPY